MSIYRKGRFYHYDFYVSGVRYNGSTKRESLDAAQAFEDGLRAEVADEDHPRPAPIRAGGNVYFVQGSTTRLIKIGFAVDVRVRVATLATGSPDILKLLCHLEGTPVHEATLHRLLAAHNSHGEWFHPEPEVLDVVEWAKAQTMTDVVCRLIATRASKRIAA